MIPLMEIIECIIPTKNKPRIYELKVGRREMIMSQ